MSAIDPTTTPAWAQLDEHAEVFNPDLRAWFQDGSAARPKVDAECGRPAC